MGRRGPRAVPTKLKILRGNPGKRPLDKSEPKPDIAIPDPPKHLGKTAIEEWDRISKQLYDLDLLTKVDRAGLAAYCVTWERWVHAEQRIIGLDEDGKRTKDPSGLVFITKNGYPIQNPYLIIADKAMGQMVKLLSEFGMTPSARSRIQLSSKKQDEDDPFAMYDRQNA